jgi:cell division protein FtsQ
LASETAIPVIRKEKTKKNGSRKLLYLLILFFVTLMLILFFRSPLSKIDTIEIRGQTLLESGQIGQAAKVSAGDQFFGFRAADVERRVSTLKGVQTVVASKHFPGKLLITVKEYPRVAFQLGSDGVMQAVLADATAIPVKDRNLTPDKPFLTGWADDNPQKASLCKTLSQIQPALLSDVSEIRPDPSASYEDKIKLYTRSQFQVVTRIAFLPEKIPYLGFAVNEFRDAYGAGTTGILTLMDQSRGEPFPKDSQPQTDSKDSGKR